MRSYTNIFKLGFDRGAQAARYCQVEADPFTIDDLIDEAVQAEDNSRQYHDFARLAGELNMRDDHEECWDHYEQGVSSGIASGARDRMRHEEGRK